MTEERPDRRRGTVEDAAEIGRLFETTQSRNRFTLVCRDPDEETTLQIEALMMPRFTADVHDELTDGEIAFWFRDLNRSDRDEDPFGIVHYHPEVAGDSPEVELHGYASKVGNLSELDHIGHIIQAARGVETED